MLVGANREIDNVISRLMCRESVGLYYLICEGLLICLPGFLVIDGIRNGICVCRCTFLKSQLKRVRLCLIVKDNLCIKVE